MTEANKRTEEARKKLGFAVKRLEANKTKVWAQLDEAVHTREA